MSNYIVLYNFNKYYNRKIKRLASFADYEALITPGENTPAQFRGFKREFRNFDFSDGVYAKHVINVGSTESLLFKTEQPDYFVLEESYTEGEGEEATTTTKVSRWFVLEAVRVRGNQYELSLRRDLLADYYAEVLSAPVFIQRGSPQIYNDPAIFNKEGFTFNQIKQHEFLLNRNNISGNQAGWVVGYVSRQDPEDEHWNGSIGPCSCKQEINLNVIDYDDLPAKVKTLLTSGTGYLNKRLTAQINFPIRRYFKYVYHDEEFTDYKKISFNLAFQNNSWIKSYWNIANINYTVGGGALTRFNTDYTQSHTYDFATNEAVLDYIREEIDSIGGVVVAFQDYIDSLGVTTEFDEDILAAYDGVVYKRNGKYYQISFSNLGIEYIQKSYTGSQLTSNYDNIAYNALLMIQSLWGGQVVSNSSSADLSKTAFTIQRPVYNYAIWADEVDSTSFDVTLPATRNQLLDSPYDMFVMPLGTVTVKRTGEADFVTYLNTSLAAARGIARVGTATKILDIQVLPYCPFPEVIDSLGNIDLTDAEEDKDYTVITKTVGGVSTDIGIILYPLHSKGTFDYNLYNLNILGQSGELPYLKYVNPETTSVLERKILSETSFLRFVSPNFAAIYDMNPQKNGENGSLLINIDYYYKPYTPYIHVQPVLDGGMYGADYNDPKGLICSGDFSIATTSSRWEEYQIQNKNFQNQFDRQITNLDVNNSIAMEQAQITGGIGILTSALQGAGAGAVAGSAGGVYGGVYGAAIGAVVGAVGGAISSAVGYTKDLELLRKSQSEARGYAQDMYTYNLGNVKALPNTLTRVSAFTPNNKIFPFIEVYDCTEEEKEALRNKIKYNGMTIMRIGHIEDYINANVTYYVQGELIRLEGINEDSHVIAEIANEIKEGAYYYGSDTSES